MAAVKASAPSVMPFTRHKGEESVVHGHVKRSTHQDAQGEEGAIMAHLCIDAGVDDLEAGGDWLGPLVRQ